MIDNERQHRARVFLRELSALSIKHNVTIGFNETGLGMFLIDHPAGLPNGRYIHGDHFANINWNNTKSPPTP